MTRSRFILAVLLFIAINSPLFAAYSSDAKAYIIYTEANQFYRDDDYDSAKEKYIEMINTYSESKYVPYALYMLTFIENDYLKIIDYLTLIEDNYSDFNYWTDAVEKLADTYYIIGSHSAAIDKYQLVKTDKAYYMMGLIYAADGFQQEAVESIQSLLFQTTNYSLAYRGYLVQAKALIDMNLYGSAVTILKEAVKLKKYSFDSGARLLYYAGKALFYQKEYHEALYAFSILRSNYPYAAESTLAKNYLTYLENNNIIVTESVSWLEDYYTVIAKLPFVSENSDIDLAAETAAEEMVESAEAINGQIVNSEIEEYVVRVGEFQDLGVANLVAVDLSGSEFEFPIGIYFRNKKYYAEIRGLTDLDTAKEYASDMIDLGYTDTKVIEVVRITEYAEEE